MACIGEMDADLVGSSGMESRLDERMAFSEGLETTEEGHRVLRALDMLILRHAPPPAIAAIRCDSALDPNLFWLKSALDKGHVATLNRMICE